ncbi:DinB family protein [Hymenobacter metallicola]|uniref:DinB family protein n=1 Tax=Hymenobacter metallicola TaxID=2563114 RepID=A0A4Z0QCS5_9BACT|nr:DinB family protein [Hymenobacter metallicola]TGE26512.1 DinB family protein [Hymenobacter metallicola]
MLSTVLLRHLASQVEALYATVDAELRPLDTQVLNFKPGPNSWSVLECLEHLNRYSRFYNQELAQALQTQAPGQHPHEVGFSWLGRKSYDTVKPENGKKQQTIKHMNPAGSQLQASVVEEFLQHQTRLLQLLASAANTDLNRKAVRIEFFRLLKLRVGEALQFVVAHEQRHVQQALRAAQAAQGQRKEAVLIV